MTMMSNKKRPVKGRLTHELIILSVNFSLILFTKRQDRYDELENMMLKYGFSSR